MLEQLQSSNILTILVIILAGGVGAFFYNLAKNKWPTLTWLRGTFFVTFALFGLSIINPILGRKNITVVDFISSIIVVMVFDWAVSFYDRLKQTRPTLERWRIPFMLATIILLFALYVIADTIIKIVS